MSTPKPNPISPIPTGPWKIGRSFLLAGPGGQVINVDIDRDGRGVWVVERCGGTTCLGSSLDPILKFNSSGTLVKSFGAGMLVRPHGLFVDKSGNVWVTDGDGQEGKGQQVFKFSPDGKVLMTLGKAGVAGAGSDTFNKPSDVLVAPNGDIFIADGHDAQSNARIVKFSPDGKFIKAWASTAKRPVNSRRRTRWPWILKAACSWPTVATIASRFSIRTETSSRNGASSAVPAAFSSTSTTFFTWPIRSPIRRGILASGGVFASAASRMASSTAKLWPLYPTPILTPARASSPRTERPRRVSRSTPLETSTAPKSARAI